MPGFDGTGPLNLGRMSGRGRGPCNAQGMRRGINCRRFFGYGTQITKEQESEALVNESKILESELKAIKDRLKELEEKK